ncbi:hypothetical protein NB721_002005 [Xanthomonas sacchari]|nr:hypothetical protein [Xanthomonas sacchari]MCW0452919.1 hypothetical protein [Xanthomonas sacchari]
MEKPVQGDIYHLFPLRFQHADQRRILVDAGIVDEDMDRTIKQQHLQRIARSKVVSNVERHRTGVTSIRDDGGDHRIGMSMVGIGMDDHSATVRGETPADRTADISTAASDERPPRIHVHMPMAFQKNELL